MKKAILKDEDGYVKAIFQLENIYEFAVSGTVKRVFSWEIGGEPLEDELFAELSVKWDGCSHFWFYGEDYKKELNNKDGYYHICGISDYLGFLRTMHFAYEIMVNHVGINKIDEKEELEELRELGLLDGYTIEYIEGED